MGNIGCSLSGKYPLIAAIALFAPFIARRKLSAAERENGTTWSRRARSEIFNHAACAWQTSGKGTREERRRWVIWRFYWQPRDQAPRTTTTTTTAPACLIIRRMATSVTSERTKRIEHNFVITRWSVEIMQNESERERKREREQTEKERETTRSFHRTENLPRV